MRSDTGDSVLFTFDWKLTKVKKKGYPFLGHQNCSNFDDKKMSQRRKLRKKTCREQRSLEKF